ncbi:hypothetical protein M434DRAFT_30008 [Hypoxylon sp. CO27-5]|nr:hypothetical protein M434DRAFT_30008 [Hypoxylon sp. CO27-5]
MPRPKTLCLVVSILLGHRYVRVGDSPGSYRPRLHQSVVSAAQNLSWVRLGFARTPLKRRGARNAGCRKGGRNEELTSHFSVEMSSCLYFGAKSGTNGQAPTRTSHLQNIVGVRHPVVPSASTIFSQINKVWTSGKDRIEDTAHSEPGAVKAYGFSFENYDERVDAVLAVMERHQRAVFSTLVDPFVVVLEREPMGLYNPGLDERPQHAFSSVPVPSLLSTQLTNIIHQSP